ncbi:MAG: hypothetical protein WEB04_00210 [Dehalococcoidia bacterium]
MRSRTSLGVWIVLAFACAIGAVSTFRGRKPTEARDAECERASPGAAGGGPGRHARVRPKYLSLRAVVAAATAVRLHLILPTLVVAVLFGVGTQLPWHGTSSAATLVSVQSGTTTIPIGATATTQTVDVAITSVNTSASVLFFN